MKKYFILLLAAVGLSSAACNDDDGGNKNNNSGGGGGGVYDIQIDAKYSEGTYVTSIGTDGSSQFTISLGDIPVAPDAEIQAGNVLTLTLYGKESQVDMVPAGIYIVKSNGMRSGLCNGDISGYFKIVDKEHADKPITVQDGRITVGLEGDTYTITADLTLADRQTLKCNYTGKIPFKRGSLSNIKEDVVVDLSGLPGVFWFEGDVLEDNTDAWSLGIMDQKLDRQAITVEIVGPKKGYNAGITPGTYVINRETLYEEGDLECVPGRMSGDQLYSTWYLRYEDQKPVEQALCYTGQVEISREGDRYTLKFEFFDDALPTPHKITGSWSGVPTIGDFTQKQ